jgi:pyridoxine 4-dehydrogenase
MTTLVGKEIGSTGYGLMGRSSRTDQLHSLILVEGLTWRPKPQPKEASFKAMKAALEAGCNFWNAAEVS